MGSQDLKVCTQCKIGKETTEFHIRQASIDGLKSICKLCCKGVNKQHYVKNRKHIIDTVTTYRKANPESYNAYRRKHRKLKEATDMNYKLRRRLRSRLYNALKGDFKAGSAVELLGCTIPELKVYIEKLFQPGMTWDNWGSEEGEWHIDHIEPLDAFDLTDKEQLSKACHYTNLRPLWGAENMSLGGKISKLRWNKPD